MSINPSTALLATATLRYLPPHRSLAPVLVPGGDLPQGGEHKEVHHENHCHLHRVHPRTQPQTQKINNITWTSLFTQLGGRVGVVPART